MRLRVRQSFAHANHLVPQGDHDVSCAETKKRLFDRRRESRTIILAAQRVVTLCQFEFAPAKAAVRHNFPGSCPDITLFERVDSILMKRVLEFLHGHKKGRIPELSAKNIVSVLIGNTMPTQSQNILIPERTSLFMYPPQNCQAVFKADSEMLASQVTCHAEIMLAVV